MRLGFWTSVAVDNFLPGLERHVHVVVLNDLSARVLGVGAIEFDRLPGLKVAYWQLFRRGFAPG